MATADLRTKILDKTAVIGVIGLGYVGLPLLMRFGEAGFSLMGFDVDEAKIDAIRAGRSYIQDVPMGRVAELLATGRLVGSAGFERLPEADCIVICVPTPLTEKMEPDLQFVVNTTKTISEHLRRGQLVVLESTTYPGTTEELLLPELERTGLKVGKDFCLAFSPEREDPGNKNFHTGNIPKVVGGITPACLENAAALYAAAISSVVRVSSTRAAELTKLLENIYRNVNIALVNELKLLTHRMDIDLWEVIDAASTKPFGFTPFYPGPVWAVIASPSIHSISPGKRRSSISPRDSSISPARSISQCPTT